MVWGGVDMELTKSKCDIETCRNRALDVEDEFKWDFPYNYCPMHIILSLVGGPNTDQRAVDNATKVKKWCEETKWHGGL